MNEPRNRLAILYLSPKRFEIIDSSSGKKIRTIWQINNEMMNVLLPIFRVRSPNFNPPDRPLSTIDRYVSEQLALTPNLTDLVVSELYQAFTNRSSLFDTSHFVWKNFINNEAVKLAANHWNKLPPSKQDEELFHELRNVDFLNVETLFSRFDPNHQTARNKNFDLLKKIEVYTSPTLWNYIRSERRKNGDRYFGLSNLGVVSRSTKLCIRRSLNAKISPHRFQLDMLLVNVFKDYLKKTGYFRDDENRQCIDANELQDNDWIAISKKCQNNIAELTNMDWEIICTERHNDNRDPNLHPRLLSGGFIKDELDCIGDRVRDYIPIPRQPKQEPDLSLFSPVIQCSIDLLNPKDVQLIEIYFRDRLKQKQIATIIDIHQSAISRRLREIVKEMIRQIRKQGADKKEIKKESIKGMKQALRQFYRNIS